MSEVNRQRHKLFGLAGGVAEHEALVASAGFVIIVGGMIDAAGDVGGLGVNGGENAAVVVKGEIGIVVPNCLDGVAGNLGGIDIGVGADFAGDDHLAGGAEGFHGD